MENSCWTTVILQRSRDIWSCGWDKDIVHRLCGTAVAASPGEGLKTMCGMKGRRPWLSCRKRGPELVRCEGLEVGPHETWDAAAWGRAPAMPLQQVLAGGLRHYG